MMSRLLVMLAAMLLYACSDDAPADKDRQRHTIDVELRPYAAWFQEEPISSFTRGFPEDYKDENNKEYKTFAGIYGEEGNFKYQTDLIHATIDMYFTMAGPGTYTPNSSSEFAQVYYSNQSKRWGSSLDIESRPYYLYGFMPDEAAEEGSSITSDEFANGAVLTLTKMSTITPNDVCVVVAAGSGNETGPSTGYAVGKFMYHTGAPNQNFIYLLFDHLYASMRFNFSVANSYNNLRTIKLKKLQLLSVSMTKYVNATVTLVATNDGSSPITDVSFNSGSYPLLDTSDNTDDGILFDNSDNPVVLTTTPSSFLGCFLPGSGNEFILKSTYDVYDKAGNLIRENCKASNRIVLSDISSTITFVRGKMLAIELTVNPTYLYMLSDPDLDNPTITVN